MTIVEFLEARLAEDERFAKEVAEEEEARQRAGRSQSWPLYNRGEPALGMHWNHEDEISVDHRRVLAEVEAKRRIVARHQPRPKAAGKWAHACPECGFDWDGVPWVTDVSECLELRCLALVYADHPDYRKEWAP